MIMNTKIHILLIEDNESDVILLEHRLLKVLNGRIILKHAECLSEALELMHQQSFDLILTDLGLPDSDGVKTINKLREKDSTTPIAVLSFRKDEKLALQTIKSGAQEYLVKDDLSEETLLRIIHYSIERKRIEESAKKSHQRFQTIFEKSPLGIALINSQTGGFLNINPMYASIVGRTIDELMKISLAKLVHPEDIEAYSQHIAKIENLNTNNIKIATRILRPNGSTIWIELTIVLFESGENGYPSYLSMIEDISEHKQMLTNLHELTGHLQNVREEERTRIGREIHDAFGSTLTTLETDLNWLSKEVTANPMHDRIRSLYELTGEAIETAKSVSTNLRPKVLDNLGLYGAIKHVICEFEQRTNIQCHLTSNTKNAPQLDKQRETSIFRIIQEVITNITRHAQATVVEIDLNEVDNEILIIIKDNGTGITKEQLLNSRSLGIIGMNERAKQLGGQLVIHGTPSQGTTITLHAPVNRVQNKVTVRVLVADDHALFRDGLKRIFSETSDLVVVAEAVNGRDVINKTNECEWDVLLLDINMSEVGGLEVLEQLSDKQSCRTLILSMYPEDEYALRAIRLGASGYLTKDTPADLLISVIRRIANGGKYVNPGLAEQLIFNPPLDTEVLAHTTFSTRELQIFKFITAGETLTDIASKLSLSKKTISTYRFRILEKMNMQNNAQLIRYAIQHNITQ